MGFGNFPLPGHNVIKWLYPGMKVKRWLFLAVVGVLLVGLGLALIINIKLLSAFEQAFMRSVYLLTGELRTPVTVLNGAIIILLGVSLITVGIRQMIRSIVSVILPEDTDNLVEIVYQSRQLHRGAKVVVVGGGTGLATLLRGLKRYTSNITAIVTVADDGGSSGRLRTEMGILPPGDIRSCLVALADTEPLMEKLFQYRYRNLEGLTGHSFGNLFIATMTEITGDFEQAIKESSKVLAIRGQVLPSTLESVVLHARMADGTEVTGESDITRARRRIQRVFLRPENAAANVEAIEAIADADIVVLGPGSLYTSILPNLLVKGIADALEASKAVKLYVCNVMTQPGETDGYTASDHVKAIVDHVGPGVVDYVLVNDEEIPPLLAEKYREQDAFPVEPDVEKIAQIGPQPITARLISETDLVRHDSRKLAGAVMRLILQVKPRPERMLWLEPFLSGLLGGRKRN